MATHIGDEGMVLPNAPKLMFDEAIKLQGGLSKHITSLLKASFNISVDITADVVSNVADEQMPLLEEWQEVVTKTRLLNKLDLRECIEKKMPIPLLYSLKTFREALPTRPIAATLTSIEQFPELVERFNHWESHTLTAMGEMVSAFSSATSTGEMTDERYVDMHIAMAAACFFRRTYRPMEFRKEADKYSLEARHWTSVPEFLTAIQTPDFVRAVTYEGGPDRAKVYQRINTYDVELALRFLTSVFEGPAAKDLAHIAGKIVEAKEGSWSSTAPFRRAMKQYEQLRTISSELGNLRQGDTLEEALISGKFLKAHRGRKFKGIIDSIGPSIEASKAIPNLESLAYPILSVKPITSSPTAHTSALEERTLPDGTPVDDNNKPLDQPARPVRLDLSEEIAALEDIELEVSEEAVYEDFRYLVDDYGFRGLQIGNYVPQKMRRFLTGAIHQSINDLADVLKMPPTLVALGNPLPDNLKSDRGISHQGYAGMSMGLALGARGRGKHSAHYEPGGSEHNSTKRHIINLTRDKGAGSYAHEFGHGLDFTVAELCNFKRGMSRYNDKTVSRVTGLPLGRQVTAVSEAWAVYWTMATNSHIQKGQAIPNLANMRTFAIGLLKDEHANDDEHIEMVMGIGHVMKHVYAKDVTPRELCSRIATKLASDVLFSMQSVERQILKLWTSAYNLESESVAKGEMAIQGLWFLPDLDTRAGIDELSEMPREQIRKLSESLAGLVRSMIQSATSREPHDDTVSKVANMLEYRLCLTREYARLAQRAMQVGQLWPTKEGHNALVDVLNVDDSEQKDVFKNGAYKALSYALISYLGSSPSGEREIALSLMNNIDTQVHNVVASVEMLNEELKAPTPQGMESAISQLPSSIKLDSVATLVECSSIRELNEVHKEIAATVNLDALHALYRHLSTEGKEIPAEKKAMHPRAIQRVNQDLLHRLEYTLERLFQKEEQAMVFMGIDPDEGGRVHKAVPSKSARDRLIEPQMQARIYKEGVDRQTSRTPFNYPTELAGYLFLTAYLRDKLQDVVNEPSSSVGYTKLIRVMAEVRDELVKPFAAARRGNSTVVEEAMEHPMAHRFLETYAVALKISLKDQSTDNPYGDGEWQLFKEMCTGISAEFSSMATDLVSFPIMTSDAGKEALKAGSHANNLVSNWVRRAYEHKTYVNVTPENSPDLYLKGLTSFAGAVSDLATQFAYLTNDERCEALSSAIGMDNTAPTSEDINKFYHDGMISVARRDHPLSAPENPSFDAWCRSCFGMLSAGLHINDFSQDENDILRHLQNDYQKHLPPKMPTVETSLMLRASAKYENRSIARNGYLTGQRLKYWATPVELFARSFETFVYDTLNEQGRESRYLVTVAGAGRQDKQLANLEARTAVQMAQKEMGEFTKEKFESRLIEHNICDYSLTYPAGEERYLLPEAFKPLVKSLSPGLGMRFPGAMALHEKNVAKNVYSMPSRRLESTNALTLVASKPEKETPILNVEQPGNERAETFISSNNLAQDVSPLERINETHESKLASQAVIESAPLYAKSSQDDSPCPVDCVESNTLLDIDEEPLKVPPALRSSQEGLTEEPIAETAVKGAMGVTGKPSELDEREKQDKTRPASPRSLTFTL